MGRVYNQLIGGVLAVGGDLLLAEVDVLQSIDRAFAKDVDQVQPFAIGLVAGLLLRPDQDAAGTDAAKDEARWRL
ncbi:hypothetical protein D3C80_1980660 [compost metagenome]